MLLEHLVLLPTNLTLDASGNDASGNPISVSPNATTTYDFTSITGNNGCASTLSNSITITVNPAINAGNNAFLSVCSDDVNTYELRNLIGPGQDTTGYWTLRRWKSAACKSKLYI